MSNPHEFEEEEFTTQFNGATLRRIFAQTKPHWRMLVGFIVLIAVAAFLDSLFTYLSKLLIDQGIVARDVARHAAHHHHLRLADRGASRLASLALSI